MTALTPQPAQPLTIYLAQGVYSGLSFSNMNFAGGLVIASADPLHPAIITGGTAYGAGLNVNNSSGITFSHIDLQTPASGSNTFVVQNSSNITFDSVHIYGTNVDPSLDANRGLYVTNSNYVTVTNSTIDHEQVGLVIANTGSATNNHITVTNNSFHDLEIDGIESGGTNYLNISGNSFTNFQEQPGDHSDAIQLWTTSLNQGSHDIVISNNVISTGIGTPPQGIFITDDSGVKPFVNVTISNNVLSDTLYNGITVSDGQNITVTGNTIRQLDAVNSSWIWLDNVTGGNISGNTMNIALHETGTNTGLVRSGNVVNSNYAPLTPAAPATPGPSATPTPAQTQTLASLSALQTALAAALYSPTAAVSSSAGKTYTSGNGGDHWTGTAGADTFNLGRGGDVVTGNGGSDTFKFAEVPWAGAHITDFASDDVLDLSGMLARYGYSGSNPLLDGHLKLVSSGAGGAQVWFVMDGLPAGAGSWLVTTLDHVAPSALKMVAGRITADATSGGAAAGTAGQTYNSDNAGDHWTGTAGNDTFNIGRGGDVVTGAGGKDTFVFHEVPWGRAEITDFQAGDVINLSAMFAHYGYTTNDAVADGRLKIVSDGQGGSQIWFVADGLTHATGTWQVANLDHVQSSQLHVSGAFITG